jgi:hypothetical protein
MTFRAGELGFTFSGIIGNIKAVMRVVFCYDNMQYNSLERYTNLYKISIPFVIVGIVALLAGVIRCVAKKSTTDIRETSVTLRSMIWLLVFAVYFILGLMLGGDGPNVNKLNGIYFAEFYLMLYGIRAVYRVVGDAAEHLAGIDAAKWLYAGLIAGIYLTCAASFVSYYFTDYAGDTCPLFLFEASYSDLLAQLEADGMADADVYTDTNYIYYCISAEVDPYELDIAQTGGASYNNISFGLPAEYEEGAVYIISADNEEYIEYISRYAEKQYAVGVLEILVCCY